MTDVVIGFLLENLRQLAVENANLIANVKSDVEGLEKDLRMLKDFLDDAVEAARRFEVVRGLVSDIRKLTYDIEDAIEAFMVAVAGHNAKNWVKRVFGVDHALMLREVALKAREVRAAMENLRKDEAYSVALQPSDKRGQTTTEKKPPVVEEDNVVGFEKPAKELIDLLTAETKELQVISIIGMPGLGKTTLANKVYNDPNVGLQFSTRAWIYVSSKYTKTDLLLSILKSGNQATNNTDVKILVQEVRAYLTWKYLIVLDDVWEPKDWDGIKEAFPDCKNGSRILLTSWNESVGKRPYKLDFLNDDQSWELLQFKAFGQRECPPHRKELVNRGKSIALQCGGLPLALVVIGGLLQTKERKDQWENVAASVSGFLAKDEQQQCLKMLNLSYDHLPPHLKACFLYFGVFPKGYDIPVWMLIRLWIAERFVQKIGVAASLEEKAEEYLDELVARNLVLVVKRSFTGRVKTCRIHDVLHEMCLEKAKEEDFLFEIKDTGEGHPHLGDRHRRLCIHSNVRKYISSKPCGLRVRTFLSFAKDRDQVILPKESVGCIPEEFKLLRVYNIQPIIFHRFPNEILKLVHLTHVAFSGEFTTIPAAMSKLLNLQTLIAETTSRDARTINIQADIFKIPQFRHLHTNKASQLAAKNIDNSPNGNIQTLTTITPESCTKDVLGRTLCIKKLGIRGKLAILEEKGWSLFDNLTKLRQLATLKLFNDVFPEPPSECRLQSLPLWNKFPPNLERLTLADTFIGWEHMNVLEMLPKLEELKLKDNAFTGVTWTVIGGGFKRLKVLQIWKTDLVYWDAKAEHFPSLQHIVLKDCTTLSDIPSSLGSVTTLRTIKLHQTSNFVESSAKKIKEQLQGSKDGLKVEIFPPELSTS